MQLGTKEEMQRLIDDANEYRKSIGESSDLTIDSFADIVTAIQSVQEQQGIAGTTAHEALTTIEGAANATKAAWQNVLTAIAGGGELKKAMEGLSTAIFGDGTDGTGLLANVIPRIQTALEGIGDFIASAAPMITARLPELVQAILPSLLTSAVSLIGALVQAIPGLMQAVWQASMEAIEVGMNTLKSVFSGSTDGILSDMLAKSTEFLSVGLEWVTNIMSGFIEGLPGMLENLLPMLLQISETIRTNAGMMVDAGMELLLKLAQGIADSLPTLIAYVPQIVSNIAGVINDNFPKILATGVQIIITLVQGIINAIPAIISNIGNICQMMIDVFMAINWLNLGVKVIQFIANGVNSLASTLPSKLMEIGNNMVNKLISINWSGLGSNVINFIRGGISGMASAIPNALRSIAQAGWNAITGMNWAQIGQNIINGIVSGIKAFAGGIANALISAAKSAWNGVCDFLGINSPSRLFRDSVGKGISEGIAYGVDKYNPTDDIVDTVSDMFTTVKRKVSSGFDVPVNAVYSGNSALAGLMGNDSMEEFAEYVLSGNLAKDLSESMADFSVQVDGRPFGRLVKKYA